MSIEVVHLEGDGKGKRDRDVVVLGVDEATAARLKALPAIELERVELWVRDDLELGAGLAPATAA